MALSWSKGHFDGATALTVMEGRDIKGFGEVVEKRVCAVALNGARGLIARELLMSLWYETPLPLSRDRNDGFSTSRETQGWAHEIIGGAEWLLK